MQLLRNHPDAALKELRTFDKLSSSIGGLLAANLARALPTRRPSNPGGENNSGGSYIKLLCHD